MKPIITANRYIFNILSYLPQTARGRRRRKLIMRSLSLKLSHEFQHHENDSTKISKEREREMIMMMMEWVRPGMKMILPEEANWFFCLSFKLCLSFHYQSTASCFFFIFLVRVLGFDSLAKSLSQSGFSTYVSLVPTHYLILLVLCY